MRGIYVLTWHGELYIKRVMRLDEECYRLISDNKHYENQTAQIDDVTIPRQGASDEDAQKGMTKSPPAWRAFYAAQETGRLFNRI